MQSAMQNTTWSIDVLPQPQTSDVEPQECPDWSAIYLPSHFYARHISSIFMAYSPRFAWGGARTTSFFGSVLVRWWNLSSHATGQLTLKRLYIYTYIYNKHI